jgi:hypothetical protein
MSRILLIVMALLIANITQAADDGCPALPHENCISVMQLKAAQIALAQFEKDQPRADLQNFFVSIAESTKDFQVSFLPRPNPSEVGTVGNTSYITMDSPGGNQFGRFVQYVISKKSNKITKAIRGAK